MTRRLNRARGGALVATGTSIDFFPGQARISDGEHQWTQIGRTMYLTWRKPSGPGVVESNRRAFAGVRIQRSFQRRPRLQPDRFGKENFVFITYKRAPLPTSSLQMERTKWVTSFLLLKTSRWCGCWPLRWLRSGLRGAGGIECRRANDLAGNSCEHANRNHGGRYAGKDGRTEACRVDRGQVAARGDPSSVPRVTVELWCRFWDFAIT